ncbi:MAG: FRG domain-containing protein [Abitibacteriaceae bacterium]|nr:FRG domain-containing protein [Abditibacteriaceae bacterium]MBV9864316.1 FRG domain-containing protein [Abditibacteriaceae bacterium]
MNCQTPQTWAELQDALFNYPWGLTAPGRHRSPYAYRGMTEDYADLTTSLMRIGGPYAQLEAAILRNFRKYAEEADMFMESEWLWLAMAQHHGLPTRLLDWTYSPYVALHFATDNTEHSRKDGVIWCLDYQKVRELLPRKLRHLVGIESFKFTVNLLEASIKNLQELAQIEKEHGEPFVMFLEPPSLDKRIVNQYALFSMMSNAEERLDTWLEQHPDIYHKIIIPAHLKWEIRDNLDQANINERMLFPGLDGLSAWLKRYYSAKDV